MPSAISLAVSLLTAPYKSKVSFLTPSLLILASLEYVTAPSRNTFETPGYDINLAAIIPPVHDSAVEMVKLLLHSISATLCSRVISPSPYTFSLSFFLTSSSTGLIKSKHSSSVSPFAVILKLTSTPLA